MVFGDNVRARMAARALPRTPRTEEEKKKDEEDEQREPHPIPPPLFRPAQTITAIPQSHNPVTQNTPRINNAVTANTMKGREDERVAVPHARTPHAPARPALHNTHPPSRIASCHHARSGRETRMIREEQDNTKVPDPTRRQGITRTRPRHSTRVTGRTKGDADTERGGHQH